jgi:hypothetical protein
MACGAPGVVGKDLGRVAQVPRAKRRPALRCAAHGGVARERERERERWLREMVEREMAERDG